MSSHHTDSFRIAHYRIISPKTNPKKSQKTAALKLRIEYNTPQESEIPDFTKNSPQRANNNEVSRKKKEQAMKSHILNASNVLGDLSGSSNPKRNSDFQNNINMQNEPNFLLKNISITIENKTTNRKRSPKFNWVRFYKRTQYSENAGVSHAFVKNATETVAFPVSPRRGLKRSPNPRPAVETAGYCIQSLRNKACIPVYLHPCIPAYLYSCILIYLSFSNVPLRHYFVLAKRTNMTIL
jgi:hypothetical protein